MQYRNLAAGERTALERQGCAAENWDLVEVADPFNPDRVRGVRFSGAVRIGRQHGDVSFPGGPRLPCGLYDSRVHACSIGNDVLVSGVRLLANYDLEDGVSVSDVGTMAVEGESGFGNGTRINALNEGGGRTLVFFDRLTAQIAYLMVLHRHRPKLIEAMEKLIDGYVKSRRSGRGAVKRGSRVSNCRRLSDVIIGPNAIVEGAELLEDGTIAGSPEDHTVVGTGVSARHFIILSGSRVEGGAMLDECFVGQGVRIGRQFSAEHSAFFANCEGFHGEVVSVFAGPYSVTHHKSTLLIAAYTSFFNAGSSTNQSNHMYKLGPVHQGILERGAKTGSGSYMLWPCRIGAFSTVLGKHYANFDTSELPFSIIADDEGKSVLTPAMNLISVGMRRDADKWISRDRRKDPDKLDLITHGYLTPYTVQKILAALEIMSRLEQGASREKDFVSHGGVQIRRLMLKVCARYYRMGVELFLGSRVSARLAGLMPGAVLADVRSAFRSKTGETASVSPWMDLCGLLAPASEVEALERRIEEGSIESVKKLASELQDIQRRYPELEWGWCLKLLEERLGVTAPEITAVQLIQVLTDWKVSAVRLNNMALSDAGKEFEEKSRIGFGIDGGPVESALEFTAVRGTREENATILRLEEESRKITEEADNLIARLSTLIG
jgi:hypothetical protein